MPSLAPFVMFVGDQCGRAEEAMALWTGAFPDSEVLEVERYGPEHPGERGLRQARCRVAGHVVRLMDSAHPHAFSITPAVSLFVELEDEAALDAAWAALGEGGTVLMPLQAYDFAPRFGWVQDRFGVSWQLALR